LLDSLLGTEPGRVDLWHAPLAVISALPGMSVEAVARIAEHRMRGVPISEMAALGGELSPANRQFFLSRYVDLVRMTATEPDAWILTCRAHSGEPSVSATVEVRLVHAGERVAIVRRRSWTS
jgi:hypothetical protein